MRAALHALKALDFGRGKRRGTIRQRLVGGFGMLVVLLLVAGVLGRRTMTQMAASIGPTLQGVQEEARQSAQLSADVAPENDHRARASADAPSYV